MNGFYCFTVLNQSFLFVFCFLFFCFVFVFLKWRPHILKSKTDYILYFFYLMFFGCFFSTSWGSAPWQNLDITAISFREILQCFTSHNHQPSTTEKKFKNKFYIHQKSFLTLFFMGRVTKIFLLILKIYGFLKISGQ